MHCQVSRWVEDTSGPSVSVNAVSPEGWGGQKGSQFVEDHHDGVMVPVGAWEDGSQLILAEFLHGANVPVRQARKAQKAAISHASTPGQP